MERHALRHGPLLQARFIGINAHPIFRQESQKQNIFSNEQVFSKIEKGVLPPTSQPLIPQGHIGAFRESLLQEHYIPPWAILSLSFIERANLEIISYVPLANKLVSVIKLCGNPRLTSYDPTSGRALAYGPSDSKTLIPNNSIAPYYGWGKRLNTTRSNEAGKLYTQSLGNVEAKLPLLNTSVQSADLRRHRPPKMLKKTAAGYLCREKRWKRSIRNVQCTSPNGCQNIILPIREDTYTNFSL